jgi:hypothetical protein
VVSEQELGGPSGSRVRQLPAEKRWTQIWSTRTTVCSSPGTIRSAASLPSGTSARHLAGDLVHAGGFEADQLADAQPSGAGQEQRVGGDPVRAGVSAVVSHRSRSGTR